MRVLISAYACEPKRGSEPGVGWNCARQVARIHEVWVLTRSHKRLILESAALQENLPNLHWAYFDLPRWMNFLKRGQLRIQAYYYLWQIGAYFVARKWHRRINFDVVHHVTFCKYWMPSFVSLLPVPFIWGPVGGGESSPRRFWSSFSWPGRIFELLRDLARGLEHFDPFVRLTAKQASLAMASSPETGEQIRSLGCRRVEVVSQVGLPREEILQLKQIPLHGGDPFRLLSIGKLVHWKGFHLGLKAFANLQRRFPQSEYWLIGDGPERERLENLTKELGVSSKVKFLGNLRRAQVLEQLAQCDALVHPSLHESGGLANMEAMAAGRPVVCLDLGGPALLVTEQTGIKVQAISPEQVVHDLAVALGRLAADPPLRARLGHAARLRVQEQFDWERKGLQILRIYEQLTMASAILNQPSTEGSQHSDPSEIRLRKAVRVDTD